MDGLYSEFDDRLLPEDDEPLVATRVAPLWAVRDLKARENLKPSEELQNLKGQFLTSLNHEIRTPLTGILGMTDLLSETPLTAEQREYLEITRACADTLYDILSATLEYAALTAGNVRAERTPFQLVRAVDALVAEHERKARAKGLDFELRLDRSLPELIAGDELRFRRLIEQLLSNAVKFTNTGHVSLSLRRYQALDGPGGERLEIAVSDTGIGIAPEMVQRVFESFEQLEGGLSRQYQGLGLGLALVRELTRLLGGDIRVESQLGKGSTFTVHLPLIAADDALPATPSRLIRQGKPRILLVEDNKVSQMIVVHMLERNEFEADCADSGMAALKAASGYRYDLVLMDLQMPGMDGFEATHRLRRLPGYEAIPILALTANSSSEFYELCRQHGMQAFLSKPVQSQQLIQTVQQFLAA